MPTPKIIFTDPIVNGSNSKVTLSNEQFIEFIKNDSIPTIFSYSMDPHGFNYELYLIKEGVFFITKRGDDNFRPIEEFFKTKEKGFPDFNKYLDARKYRIEKYEDYLEFKESSYFGPYQRNYWEFKDGKKRGFKSVERYKDAIRLGIKSSEEYEDYVYSGYSNYKDYRLAQDAGFNKKSEFTEAYKLGIEDYQEYRTYKRSGFENYSEYQKSLKLGFKNKFDYEKAKELGFDTSKQFDDYLDEKLNVVKLEQINVEHEAEKALQDQKYNDFIRLKYLSIEKLVQMLYIKIFKEELDLERIEKLDEIIVKIEETLNKYLFDREAFLKWYKIYKNVIHSKKEIKRSTAEEADIFFTNLYNTFKRTLDEIFV